MIGLVYTLRLLEPVLANSLGGDTNSAQSLYYIPGSLIRGAVIGTYLQRQGSKVPATDTIFRRLFLSGHTCYLHAYPAEDGIRSLPTPLPWKAPKREVGIKMGRAFNLASIAPNEENLKGMTFESWWQRGQTAYYADAGLQVNVHTQRDAVYGRAREGQGAVFRYEALAAGNRLMGVILAEDSDTFDTVKKLLGFQENKFIPFEFLIGKARTAGYGRVRMEDAQPLPSEWREGWRWEQEREYAEDDEELFLTPPPDTVNQFTLTLLSNTLVRDANGQFTLDPLPALEARLKTKLKVRRVFRGADIVGGFNRTWGLYLPQVAALAAGSVFVLASDTPLAVTDLHTLEATGIGERRTEGFGRLTVDFYQPDEVDWVQLERPTQPDTTLYQVSALDEPSTDLAKLLLQRLLRRELDEKLLKAVHDHPIQGSIPKSQLSRWRVLLRNALAGGEPASQLQRLTKFYAEEQKRRSYSWRAMERARIQLDNNKPRLTDWIFTTLTAPASPWDQLGYGQGVAPNKGLGTAPESRIEIVVDEAWRMEYKLRLLDLSLAAYAKRERPEQSQRGSQ